MIRRLTEMYECGSITGYQLTMECLLRLDPDDPGNLLAGLPEEILDEMLAYASRYDPSRPYSATFTPAAEAQVRAAARWIFARRARSSEAVAR